jgi:deazaflavin-dependent oxidoreductase (nitroreductase family)
MGALMYRWSKGRGMGGSKDAPVVMLTTPGRRTGQPRSTCVRALQLPDGYLVWGTGSGSRQDPDWFRNLRVAGGTDLQVRAERTRASARELQGDERDLVWNDLILARLPGVAKYARKAGRTIPVAMLSRR